MSRIRAQDRVLFTVQEFDVIQSSFPPFSSLFDAAVYNSSFRGLKNIGISIGSCPVSNIERQKKRQESLLPLKPMCAPSARRKFWLKR